MSTFLLEIGTEELPARFIPQALTDLQKRAAGWLQEHRLPYGALRTAGTPRRLVLEITEVGGRQEDTRKEVKGPAARAAFGPDGQPTKALLGFAHSQNVPVESLVRKTVAGGEFVFAVQQQPGRLAAEILKDLVVDLLPHLPLLRGMRWGSYSLRFERPVRWLLSLLDEVPLLAELDGLKTGRVTFGHRFLADGPVLVPSAGEYWNTLESAHVWVDPAVRRRLIEQQVQDAVAAVGGRVLPDPDLLEEVTFLVESPLALLGNFDPAFLEIPEAVSTTVMKRHQRYFPVYDTRGRLMAHFVVVTNGSGDPQVVRAGNERVLRARLSDARFFYQEDLKMPLSGRVEVLKRVTFMEGLGSLHDKIDRLTLLARHAYEMLAEGNPADVGLVDRAARLCKTDLVTSMVREFPELQGVMGHHYALQTGEPAAVAQAVAEHYLPTGPGSALPQTPVGVALSLAEKFDNLAGCFGRGLIPTGSQDPFALRRQAGGIVLIAWERDRHLNARFLLELAAEQFQAPSGAVTKLDEFLRGRLRALLRERGLRHDIVDGVLACGDPLQDLLLPNRKADALQEWLGSDPDTAERTIYAADRVTRLATHATSSIIDEGLFEKDSEGALFARLQSVDGEVTRLLAHHDYRRILEQFSHLNEAVERFFDFHEGVFVMVKDNPPLQRNRLALLKCLSDLYANVADFRLVGVTKDKERREVSA